MKNIIKIDSIIDRIDIENRDKDKKSWKLI